MANKPLIPYKIRFNILIICLGIFFLAILGQLFNLQVIKSEGLVSQAKSKFQKRNVFLRGDVFDRNGNLLVLDIVNYDLYNNVRDFNKIPKEKIKELVSILEIPEEELINGLKQKINTKIISKINEDKANFIKSTNADFIYLVPTVTRKYPHKKLASHIIGFVNNDHIGQHGVEYFHEKLLTKKSSELEKTSPFPKGTSIVLSIDSILQQYAEEELERAIKKTRAQRGAVLVLSPQTGEIYTFAVYPYYDPNLFFKEKVIKNWAITDIYEPGSTFKIVTVASALENMSIKKDSLFFDDGKLVVGKRIIKNHHKTKPKNIDLLNLFKESSNVAAGKVGLSMEPKHFYNSIKNAMFSQRTNVDLPGESRGILINYKDWKEIDKATTAIGQGAISVTPIQLACVVSAIANGGIWVQPHVLKGIWEPKYMLVNDSPYKIEKKRIFSEDTANFVSSLLRQSVKENVEAMAYIAGNVPGYEVAGKTGTAQKVKPDGKGYWAGHTVASFVGYLPAQTPKILTIVVIDDPLGEGGWGNTVAGPVFNKVSEIAARRILERK